MDTEKDEFDRRMTDGEFRAALERIHYVVKGTRAYGREELKREMKKWDAIAESKPSSSGRIVRLRTIAAVAASFLLLAVAVVLTMPKFDAKLMADQALKPYPNVIAPLQKSADDAPQRYQQAFQFYEMGYYGKAEDIFRTLDQSDPPVEFFRGLNALLDNRLEEANEQLGSIAKDQGHRFYEPARWYYALSLVMLDKQDEAVSLLNAISEGGSAYAGQATDLIDDL